jgi:hypothetical protein
MKVATDYSDYEESMDALLNKFNRGHDTLYVDWEWEIADYFGPLEGMPPEEPTSIKGLHLLPKGGEPRRYALSLLEAEYFYKSEYIPMVEAIIEGLKMEMVEIKELDFHRKGVNALEWRLDDFEDQLQLLKSSRVATLSQIEKEEREAERLVKQKPKKKPPRKDLRRKRMVVEDPDLENLGGEAGGDRDLSMNHKRVASAERVALAFLKEAILKKKIKRNKSKQDAKDNEKAERKERGKKVREQLESDDKPYIMSDAGNKITFSSAIKADKKTKQRKEAEKILRKQKDKANAEANKKKKEQKEESVGGESNPFKDIEVDGKIDIEEPEPSVDDKIQEKVEKFQEEVSQEQAQEEQAQKQDDDTQVREGLKDSLLNDPRNFYGLLEKGTEDIPRDVFLHAFAEQTMHKDFTNLKGLGLSPVEEIDTSRLDSEIEVFEKALAEGTDDAVLKDGIEKALETAKQTKQEYIQDKTSEVVKKRIEEIRKVVDTKSVDDVFPNTSNVEPNTEFQTDAVDLIGGGTQEARDELKKNDALNAISEVRDIYKAEDGVGEEEAQKLKQRSNDFINKMKDLLPKNPNKDSSKAIQEVIDLMGELPVEQVKEFEEGYKNASRKFKELFTGDKDIADILAETAGLVDKMFSNPLSQAKGSELGQAMASAVMEQMFVNNYDYGLPSDDDFVVTYLGDEKGRDGKRKEIIEERPRAYEMNLDSIVRRFGGDAEGQSNRREEASKFYGSKLEKIRDQIKKEGHTPELKKQLIKYESSLDGVYVSMLMEGDKNLPEGRSKVDPFFLEHAKQTKNPDAMAIVASLSKENKEMDSYEVRQLKKDYLSSLSDGEFCTAMGGDSGPFKDLLEALDSQYCPDLPLNGESAGKKVPIEDCPLPIPPEAKEILREHLTTISMDQYSIVPQDEGSSSFKDNSFDKKHKSPFKTWLDKNKDKYLKALMSKDEEALAGLFAMMREANIKDLDLSEAIKDYDEGGYVDKDKKNKYRMKKINEILKRKDVEGLKGVLKKLDIVINEKSVPSSPSKKATKTTYFPKRLVGTLKKFAIKNLLMKFASDRPFISPCLSSDPIGETKMERTATSYVDYQQRAFSFERGMRVYPFFGGKPDKAGVVIQIFPAIGMVDVQFPHGVSRYPVEDLVLDTSGDYENVVHQSDSLTMGVVPVSAGPSAKKVASRYLRRKKGN